MDINKIKQKLEQHNQEKAAKASKTSKTSNQVDNLFWKPKQGTQKVRVVPSPHNPDYPGTELYFYYCFGKGNTVLSPTTFNLPDPIVTYCNELMRERTDVETFKKNSRIKDALTAKKRVYVPIIVRGENGQPDTGPFYWGLAPSYYEELLKICSDEDYGDISDFERGRDLTVEFTEPEKEGAYPKTVIRPRGNVSVTTEDADLFEKIQAIKDIKTVYKCPTNEELQAMLLEYLKSGIPDQSNQKQTTEDVKVVTKVDKVAEEFSNKFKDVFSSSADDMPF